MIHDNEIGGELAIGINGRVLTALRWKAKKIDAEHETEITLTFRGADSTRLRSALQELTENRAPTTSSTDH